MNAVASNSLLEQYQPGLRRGATWFASALLIVATALTGCQPAQQAPAAAVAKPPEVLVAVPTSGEITDYEDFTGRTVAPKTIEMRARVTGYLDKIDFKEGVEVQKGDLLFEIDPRSYEAEVARNESFQLQAEAKFKRADADFKRSQQLLETRAISPQEFDKVSGDRAEAQANIGVAKANLDLAKLNLSFTKVRAPISGRPGRTMLDPGNLIKVDETVLTMIVSQDPMFAYFDVDERTLLRIRRYAQEGRLAASDQRQVPVMMGLSDEQGYPHQGTISFVDNRLDASSGTLQVRGVFSNKDRILSPGLFVRVRLPVGEPYRAVLIDEHALATDQGQKFVYVVNSDNKVEYRRVQVGKLQNGKRAILDGLTESEHVVVSGLQRVRPGGEVTPKLVDRPDGDGPAEVAQAKRE